MEISPLVHEDLLHIAHFQPPDWSDIIPALTYYIDSPFCYPIKVVEHNEILGFGTSIVHKDISWLATIITHPEKRNKGIGTFVTAALIDSLQKQDCRTIMLVATPLGEFVYKKLGFETDGEYLFFKEGHMSDGKSVSENIVPLHAAHMEDIYTLDQEAAGEDRRTRLNEFLAGGKVYMKHSRVEGFFLPFFGEGLIVATNPEAGNALLNEKHISAAVTILPKENLAGSDYLRSRGFVQYRTAARMRLGIKRSWKPEMIYSRVSGAIG